jgi:hypothetical protein
MGPTEKRRCQSCGMPISEDPASRGTELNGSPSELYCPMCYRDGAFTKPDLTVEEMVRMSIDYMSTRMGFDPAEAERLSREFIPGLQRWGGSPRHGP